MSIGVVQHIHGVVEFFLICEMEHALSVAIVVYPSLRAPHIPTSSAVLIWLGEPWRWGSSPIWVLVSG